VPVGGVQRDLAVRIARRSSEVCTTSGSRPLAQQLAAAAGLGLALLRQVATSTQPVNRFLAFHSLSPWRSSTRYSLNYWAINLGFASAAVLAGFAAQFDYLLLFVVDAATTLATFG
jgi:hypothetical protein